MQLKNLPLRFYGFGLVAVLVIGFAFYLIVGRDARSSTISRIEKEQDLLVRAEAGNLESFFIVFGESIAVLSQLKTITSESSAIWELDVFVEQWRESGLVDGVALTDGQGNLMFNSNVEGTQEKKGLSLADRDYFLWAKNEAGVGEYFVGEPVVSRLGASKGNMIVPVASPVYRNGRFVGVVVAAVELDRLARRNLELMRVSETTDTMLIGKDGKLLYSNTFSEAVDSNFIDFLTDNPFPGSSELRDGIENAMKKGIAPDSSIITFAHPDSNNKIMHTLAYYPVNLGDQKWLIVFASKIDDLWGFSVPMNIRVIVLFILIFFTIFVFGAVTVKETQKRSSVPPSHNQEEVAS